MILARSDMLSSGDPDCSSELSDTSASYTTTREYSDDAGMIPRVTVRGSRPCPMTWSSNGGQGPNIALIMC